LAIGDASFDLVREGNSHYAAGDYDKALESYENIEPDEERSDQSKHRQATVMYNRANCLYELEKPDEAVDLYQEAAMMSRDPVLTNQIRFNLANSYCRQAIAQQQGNLQDAVDTLIKALRIYRDVKKAMPDDPDVRQNIAVAAEALRALLEQQRQQEGQEQQQEEEQENLADKIKELLKRQKDLLIESSVLEQVEGPADPNAATVTLDHSSNSTSQSQLSQDTSGLNEQVQGMMAQQLQQAMQQQQQQPQPPVPLAPSPPALAPEQQKQLETLQTVSTELAASVEDQGEAVLQFRQPSVKDAITAQARSTDHLQAALDALKDPQQQEQNQNEKGQEGENEDQKQQEQQEQQQGEQENQQADQQEQQGDQQQNPQQARPEEQPEASEDEKMKATEALVRQILQMEKERREEQKKQSRRRRAKVERDW
jgi:tetratricopeptide (TPR) repeat protein